MLILAGILVFLISLVFILGGMGLISYFFKEMKYDKEMKGWLDSSEIIFTLLACIVGLFLITLGLIIIIAAFFL